MKPAVVFLDWDGTVCGSKFWGHWAEGSHRAEASALIQSRFFQASPDIVAEWMRGARDAENVVAEIARRTGLAAADLHTGLRESCERMQLLDDGILTTVAGLRKSNIKVVIATDNMDTFRRWTAPALALESHFDGILDSYSLRALKRDKDNSGNSKFFAPYLAQNNIDPAATVLVDDGAHNAVVADFGIRYIQVTPQLPALRVLSSIRSSVAV
jgi:FMN phosphatase YigB (HAD superfamily)